MVCQKERHAEAKLGWCQYGGKETLKVTYEFAMTGDAVTVVVATLTGV